MDSKGYFENSKFVKELNSSDFKENPVWVLKSQNEHCKFVLFYAPWCPYCKKMKNEWENFGKVASYTKVYAYNCEKNKQHLSQITNDLPELVKSFPTIIVYKNGHPSEQIATTQDERNVKYFIQKSMELCNTE